MADYGFPAAGREVMPAYYAAQENQRRNALQEQNIANSQADNAYNASILKGQEEDRKLRQEQDQRRIAMEHVQYAASLKSLNMPPEAALQEATNSGWIKSEEDVPHFLKIYNSIPAPVAAQTPEQVMADKVKFEEKKNALAMQRDAAKPATAAAAAPSMTEVVDPADPTRLLRVDAKVYKGGTLGELGVLGVSGKEPTAAAKELKVNEGKQGAADMLAEMRSMYGELDKLGAIVNPDKGVMNNVGAYISSSGAGQAGGSLIGSREQSLRKSITNAVPLLLQQIKQATGMSAQQMNSNKELEFFKAAASDPHSDIKSNLKALDNIERLLGGQTESAAAPEAAAPSGVIKYDAQGRRIP